jgi:hypothetical protein
MGFSVCFETFPASGRRSLVLQSMLTLDGLIKPFCLPEKDPEKADNGDKDEYHRQWLLVVQIWIERAGRAGQSRLIRHRSKIGRTFVTFRATKTVSVNRYGITS